MVDVELYGGYRGFVSHLHARTKQALGAYHRLSEIEWTSVRRLVFVCKGNICRSPYASTRARALGIQAASYGLNAAEGAPADPLASRNALQRGVDLSAHRAAAFHCARLEAKDLVIVFEPAQLAQVQERCRSAAMSLLGIWARPLRPHVQDPYGRSDRYFQQCFTVIDANVEELARRLAGARGRR